MIWTTCLLTVLVIGFDEHPTSPYTRFAVVTSAEVESSGISTDLIRALRKKNLRVVGSLEASEEGDWLRTENMDGNQGSKSVPSLDGIILLQKPLDVKTDAFDVTVVDFQTASRLLRFQVKPPMTGGEIAQQVDSALRAALKGRPPGERRSVLVAPLVPIGVGNGLNEMKSSLEDVIRTGLAATPATTIVETDAAWAVERELRALQKDAATRRVPAAISGEIREVHNAESDRRYQITLHITTQHGTRTIEQSAADVVALRDLARTKLVPDILTEMNQLKDSSLSRDKQIEFLHDRARRSEEEGRTWDAIGLREAALALGHAEPKQVESLCTLYLKQVPYGNTMDWNSWEPSDMVWDFRRKGHCWRRAVELLRLNEPSRAESEVPIRLVLSRAGQTITEFENETPDEGWDMQTAERRATLATLEDELRRCTIVHRALVGDYGPRLLKMCMDKIKDKKFGDFERENINRQLQWAADWPTHNTKDTLAHLRMSLKALRRLERVSVQLTPELAVWPYELPGMIVQISLDPDYPREFTIEQWTEFLDELGKSRSPAVREFGRFGVILSKHSFGENGKKTSAEDTKAAMDAWAIEARAALPGIKRVDELVSLARTRIERHTFAPGPKPGLVPPPESRPAQLPLDFARIRVLVYRKDGSVMPFSHSAVEGMPCWGPIGKVPTMITRTGRYPAWINDRSILIERKACETHEIYFDESKRVISGVGEDNHLWVASAEPRIRVWSYDGDLVAEAGPDDGLPPMRGYCVLLPMAAGSVLAVASDGTPFRSWCGLLTLDNGKIKVDILHEASHVFSPKSQGDRLSDSKDLQLGYPLYNAFVINDPAGPVGVVEREKGGRYGLKIDPRARTVDLFEFPLHGWPNIDSVRGYRVSENGNWYLGYSGEVRTAPATTTRPVSDREVRTLWKNDDQLSQGMLFPYHGVFIAPGETWLSVDPRTNVVREFDDSNLEKLEHWDLTYSWGTSQLSGLLLFGGEGEVYHAMTDGSGPLPDPTPPSESPGKTCAGLIETTKPLVAAVHAYHRDRGLWPRALGDLVPHFIDALPDLALDYSWSIEGPNHLRVQRKEDARRDRGSTLVHVFGGAEQGAYEIRAGKTRFLSMDRTTPLNRQMTPELAARIVQELDHRLKTDPTDVEVQCARVSLLYRYGSIDDACAAALAWVQATPFCSEGRSVLRYTLLRRASGLDWRDSTLRARVIAKGPHPNLGVACIHSEEGQGWLQEEAFQKLKSLPPPTSEAEWLNVEYVLFDRAFSTYGFNRDTAAIETCDFAEQTLGAAKRPVDPSFLLIRGAALLRKGEKKKALADAKALKRRNGEPSFTPAARDEFIAAAEAGDTTFKYEFYELNPQRGKWPQPIE